MACDALRKPSASSGSRSAAATSARSISSADACSPASDGQRLVDPGPDHDPLAQVGLEELGRMVVLVDEHQEVHGRHDHARIDRAFHAALLKGILPGDARIEVRLERFLLGVLGDHRVFLAARPPTLPNRFGSLSARR